MVELVYVMELVYALVGFIETALYAPLDSDALLVTGTTTFEVVD